MLTQDVKRTVFPQSSQSQSQSQNVASQIRITPPQIKITEQANQLADNRRIKYNAPLFRYYETNFAEFCYIAVSQELLSNKT